MFAYLHRILPCYYALLSILLGLSLAWAFSNATALYLDSGIDISQVLEQQKTAPSSTLPPDNKFILQRNIFNSAHVSSGDEPHSTALTTENSSSAAEERRSGDALSDTELAGRNIKEAKNLQLVGTIAGAQEALAVISSAGEIGVYRLGDLIATSAKVVKIERLRVYVENSDTSISILELDAEFGVSTSPASSSASAARGSKSASGSGGIQQINDTSWRISNERAELIRSNIATVVREARVEPVVNQGQTQGFVVKYIQPGTLLTEMGLRRGDILKQVNGISLDSPEKGLQVFQQLRESKSMDLGIERNNTPMTFKYEIR